MGQPKRVEDAKILVANTPMDTDKIKIYGARVRVDSMQKARIFYCPDCSCARSRLQERACCPADQHALHLFPEHRGMPQMLGA